MTGGNVLLDAETTADVETFTDVESIKRESRFLRGGLAAALADPRVEISEADRRILSFHGVFPQRDGRMAVRVRVPAGRLTSGQYLALDDIANRHAGGVLRLTPRQEALFHGIPRDGLRAAISDIHQSLLTTYGAGGDVVRNIMANPVPFKDAVHARVQDDARRLSKLLAPRSRAYRELWLEGTTRPEPPETPAEEVEPLYGAAYLPHRLKIALATVDDNSVDAHAQDLGIVALFDGDRPEGYALLVGGGLGGPPGRATPPPRVAQPLCLVPPEELLPAVEALVAIYRDHGERGDRRRARLATLVDERGIGWLKARLEELLSVPLGPPPDLPPMQTPELIGWYPQGDGKCFLGVPLPGGRIADLGENRLRTGLRVVIEKYWPTVVLTPSQHVLLCDLPAHRRDGIEADLQRFGIRLADDLIPLERWTMACPALPECPLARAESETAAPRIVDALAETLAEHGLSRERMILRIAGCTAGCTRPQLADIGLTGIAPDRYRLYVGGDARAGRLGLDLSADVAEQDIGPALDPLFARYAAERRAGEGFGDFCLRLGLAPAPTPAG